MADYKVVWEIDIWDVESAVEAAKQALRYQRDPESTAVVFDVTDDEGETTRIDLLEDWYAKIHRDQNPRQNR